MSQRISLIMIVKNESAHLGHCLESVKNFVDEIVIVDTGSNDDTISIARRYTPIVFSFSWTNDFSAARNFAIDRATGDWILSLDADEEIEFNEIDSLHTLINRENDKEAFLLPLLNSLSDSTQEYNTFYVLRLFKNNRNYRYFGKIHEQISLPNQEQVGLAKDPFLKHKLLPLKARHKKRYRNLSLLKEALKNDPHNPFLNYYLGVEWLMLTKPAYALPFLQYAYHNLNDDQLLFRAPALKYFLLSLKELGRLDEALSLCLEESIQYADFTDLFYLGGLLLEEKKEYPIALKWFHHAISCGTPPPIYSHLKGSGSFLAYYHLGFCYERMGNLSEARSAFETALKTNPRYHFPLYSLFLNLLSEKGPSLCYRHLSELGFLNDPVHCLTLADLFFQSNNVEQAYHCLDNNQPRILDDGCFSFYYGKYCVYSGRILTGLKALSSITEQRSYYTSAQSLVLTAQLLSGNFEKARRLALKVWKNHSTRGDAYLFLWLIRFIQNQTLPTVPPKVREKELFVIAADLLKDYKRFQSNDFKLNPYADSYSLGLKALMKTTEKGFKWLLDDYEENLQDLKTRFTAKYGTRQLMVDL